MSNGRENDIVSQLNLFDNAQVILFREFIKDLWEDSLNKELSFMMCCELTEWSKSILEESIVKYTSLDNILDGFTNEWRRTDDPTYAIHIMHKSKKDNNTYNYEFKTKEGMSQYRMELFFMLKNINKG